MIKHKYFPRLIVDLVVITICFIIAYSYFPFSQVNASKQTIYIYSYIIAFWYFASQVSALYEDFLKRNLSQEIQSVIKTILIQNVFIIIAFFFINQKSSAPRLFVIAFCSLQIIFLPIVKWLMRWYYSSHFYKIKNKSIQHLLIIGAGDLGLEFKKSIDSEYNLDYKVEGFLDDENKSNLNIDYLGKITDLKRILDVKQIDHVFIALPNNAVDKINNIVQLCDKQGKRVSIIPNYYKISSNIYISSFGRFPTISLRKIPLDNSELRFFKRVFDLFFVFFLFLFVFSWLFPILIFCIKISSKGPIFYLQERWGINGKKIVCYKFRSMFSGVDNDIDENGRFRATEKNDPRVTKFGAILRKHNLDELPQFLNVLKGDMSVVGPRPHASLQNEEMKDIVNNYMLRHAIRPGITGWAQVNGYRGETKENLLMQKRVDCDIWYIENWSLALDCQIILQTVINMIKGEKNAY